MTGTARTKVLVTTLDRTARRPDQPAGCLVHRQISARHAEGDFSHSLARLPPVAQTRAVLSQGRQPIPATEVLRPNINPRRQEPNEPIIHRYSGKIARHSAARRRSRRFYQRVILQRWENDARLPAPRIAGRHAKNLRPARCADVGRSPRHRAAEFFQTLRSVRRRRISAKLTWTAIGRQTTSPP